MYYYVNYSVTLTSVLEISLTGSSALKAGVCSASSVFWQFAFSDSMIFEELTDKLSCFWLSTIEVSFTKRQTILSLIGCDGPFPIVLASTAEHSMRLWVIPTPFLTLTFNQVNGSSNIRVCYVFVLCLVICTAALRERILIDTNIFSDGLPSFNCLLLHCHLFCYPIV